MPIKSPKKKRFGGSMSWMRYGRPDDPEKDANGRI
jgi:hypothetical protein